MNCSIKSSLIRDNFKVRYTLRAEISMKPEETDQFLEMLTACKGSEQGLKVQPDTGGYPYKGVVIEESHDISFNNYILKGIDPEYEAEFSKKVKMIMESSRRYKDFLNHFSSPSAKVQ